MKITLLSKACLTGTFLSLFFAVSVSASAQTHSGDSTFLELRNRYKVENGKVYSLDGQRPTQHEIDSVRMVLSSFFYDQFHHFEDPEAPFFMFMSRDANMSLGMGGTVRVKSWYEWGGAMPINGLSPALIPIPANPARSRHLGANVSGSELFFRVLGKNRVTGEYQVYLQAQFSGYNGEDFKLKKAYASLRNFTVGLTTSTFSDPGAMAPDFDASGINGKFDESRILIRYMRSLKEKYTGAISLEYPKQSLVQGPDSVAQPLAVWLPDLAAMLQYNWTRTAHIRLSGIIRSLGYRDMLSGINHRTAGGGLQLSTAINVGRQLNIYGNINYGKGLAGITNDLMAGSWDLVIDPDNPGVLNTADSWGWNVGLMYSIKPGLFLSGAFSHVRYGENTTELGSTYKYGMYAFGALCYDLTPRISFVGQFTWGHRKNYDGAHKSARRVEAVAMFTF